MNQKALIAATVAIALAAALAGCRTVSGRTAGNFVDDTTTTTKVKTAIAAVQIGTLTRVDVDTRQGVVYLTGTAMNDTNKQQILEAARGAAEGKPVVDHLMVAGQAAPAASPQTGPAEPPEIKQLKFGRMERDTGGSGPVERWAAYDQQGQRVATVYTIPTKQLPAAGLANLDAEERQIDHVSIYPHPGSDGTQYHVVLWHVSRQDAARMQ